MQTLYSASKVNNEIELCEIRASMGKKEIERALLKNRISYFIRWQKPSIFSRRKDICTICVNENSVEEAEEIVQSVSDELGIPVRFIKRHFHNEFL